MIAQADELCGLVALAADGVVELDAGHARATAIRPTT